MDILSGDTLIYAIYALAAVSAVLAVEALYVGYSRRRARTGNINRRLKRLAAEGSHAEHALKSLLKERGLSESGDFAFGLVALNRLYTQSGITGSPVSFFSFFLAGGAVVGLLLLVLGFQPLVAALMFVAVGVILPWLHLRRARTRRVRKFEIQLPDALEMIVRSLKAGHPVPVAVALVAREMPDPLGTEFGIVADEITFGLSLEQAARKLTQRVGFEGLNLMSVSLSIQAKTGGNLTEILGNLATVMRERLRLRLKVRALSAEGRVSAWMISFFPLAMFGILMLLSPSYYGDVWGDPMIMPVFVIFGAWALLGDFIMYRMVNFDF